jgi:hypothetical protein
MVKVWLSGSPLYHARISTNDNCYCITFSKNFKAIPASLVAIIVVFGLV